MSLEGCFDFGGGANDKGNDGDGLLVCFFEKDDTVAKAELSSVRFL